MKDLDFESCQRIQVAIVQRGIVFELQRRKFHEESERDLCIERKAQIEEGRQIVLMIDALLNGTWKPSSE